ncbi:MAG: hypothetical protein K9L85_01460, partial [Candidatus Peribacteraceae bacterium]|nr:hypothetical protein [Candidatus Peribacteraceae bacterium]
VDDNPPPKPSVEPVASADDRQPASTKRKDKASKPDADVAPSGADRGRVDDPGVESVHSVAPSKKALGAPLPKAAPKAAPAPAPKSALKTVPKVAAAAKSAPAPKATPAQAQEADKKAAPEFSEAEQALRDRFNELKDKHAALAKKFVKLDGDWKLLHSEPRQARSILEKIEALPANVVPSETNLKKIEKQIEIIADALKQIENAARLAEEKKAKEEALRKAKAAAEKNAKAAAPTGPAEKSADKGKKIETQSQKEAAMEKEMEKRKAGVLERVKEIGGGKLDDSITLEGMVFKPVKGNGEVGSVENWNNDDFEYWRVTDYEGQKIMLGISVSPPHNLKIRGPSGRDVDLPDFDRSALEKILAGLKTSINAEIKKQKEKAEIEKALREKYGELKNKHAELANKFKKLEGDLSYIDKDPKEAEQILLEYEPLKDGIIPKEADLKAMEAQVDLIQEAIKKIEDKNAAEQKAKEEAEKPKPAAETTPVVSEKPNPQKSPDKQEDTPIVSPPPKSSAPAPKPSEKPAEVSEADKYRELAKQVNKLVDEVKELIEKKGKDSSEYIAKYSADIFDKVDEVPDSYAKTARELELKRKNLEVLKSGLGKLPDAKPGYLEGLWGGVKREWDKFFGSKNKKEKEEKE